METVCALKYMRNSYLVARAFPRGLFVFVLGRAGVWKGAVWGLASPQEALSFPTRNLLAQRPPQPHRAKGKAISR